VSRRGRPDFANFTRRDIVLTENDKSTDIAANAATNAR
jgi:hypothetical protein